MPGRRTLQKDHQLTLLEELQSHLSQAGDIWSEWVMFCVYIVEAAALNCGHKVVGASQSGHPQIRWWTLG